MNTALLTVSTVLALVSPLPYIISILKGKTRPHRTTSFVLLVITVISTVSLLAEHDKVALWLAGASAVQMIFIFALSIPYGMGGWSRADIICLICAMAGIILWKITRDASLALYLSVTADAIGMIPALLKTFRYPKTETWVFYAMNVGAAVCNLFAVSAWNVHATLYPLYIMSVNMLMVCLIGRPRFIKIRSSYD